MNTYLIYGIILVILLILELLYFTIADKFDIIDKPNERSSHSSIVRRGGGIIFLLGAWIWSIVFGFQYPFFLAAVTLAAGISFIDDIHSLPDSARLIVQFAAMGLLVWQLFIMAGNNSFIQTSDLWIKIGFIAMALVVCVGATNIYNFMDGINGITACYSAAVLLPLLLVNRTYNFVDTSFLLIILLAVIVFSFFNFRPRGKAKCFAGDVGSVGIAFILLFAIGALIVKTGDITWLIFLLVYGVDGCLTICHRILLHENLGQAHRKHVYQLMAKNKPPRGISDICNRSIGGIYRIYIFDTQQCLCTLDIFIMRFCIVKRYVYIIQEEILPSPRRIFKEFIKKMILAIIFINKPDL